MKTIITASLAIICLAVLFADFSVALALPKSGQASVSCCKSKSTIYSSSVQATFGCGYAGIHFIAPKLKFGTYACTHQYPLEASDDLQSFNDVCTNVFKGVTKDAGKCANNVMNPSILPFTK
ncbi:hypothetical protein FA10DRAFT_260925 [Acaromyces ingoldii]|uniref:Hydrophobin n=1 Tax=Acaromyces ingoldii TaxID=215250 RepID=A0A316YMQ2_9BASI|nr:hypothetical protein FA10DRAFT_260925 [Acaromyces ingoldii]PWN89025.1 hypothetical protein FA10DRAFT_260925 [Acaromyces ingoldii]